MSMSTVAFVSGLDLGQAQEFTAVAVLEKTTSPDPEAPGRKVNRYAVRHLERFPLRTPYPQVGARLAQLFAGPPLADSTLVVDQTVVGRPALTLLRRSRIPARIRHVTVTGGHRASADDRGGWLVPKRELVGTLQVLLQARRITIASTLPEAPTLVQELMSFRAKATTSTGETLDAWREGPHDDLVLAVAIAAWEGEHYRELQMWIV
jgi:hypothetical protein